MNTDLSSPSPYRILIVDNNPAIHDDFKKILLEDSNSNNKEIRDLKTKVFGEQPKSINPLQYTIDSAYQGEEALSLVKKAKIENQPYALAFVDIVMPPGKNGIETTKLIWGIDYDIQIVLCSAYSEFSWEDIIHELGINDNFVILKKPFESIEIRQLACCLSHKWTLAKQVGHQHDKLHQSVLDESKKLKEMYEKFQTRINS